MGSNKTVSFRMSEDDFERLQRSLQKRGFTVTDFLVQKIEEYLNSIPIEEEDDPLGNKVITMSMHRSLYYAITFQREEIRKALHEAEEKSRFLSDEDEQDNFHIILTEDGEIYTEDFIPRSLREALRKGEAVILVSFKPTCILPKDISSAELVGYLELDEVDEDEEQEDFLEFLKGNFDVKDTDTVVSILSTCSPEGIVEQVWEYQHNWNTRSFLYSTLKDNLNDVFDNDFRIAEAEKVIGLIDLDEFEIIK